MPKKYVIDLLYQILDCFEVNLLVFTWIKI